MVFQLVSRRYERGSIVLTSNKTFSEWGHSSQTKSSPPPSSTAYPPMRRHLINGPSFRLKDRIAVDPNLGQHAIILMPNTDT
jgi:DNA replication protein DnaC